MKTMTCKQLGGACDQEFTAKTFDEMGKLSRDHAMEMFEKQDALHLEAMNKMKDLMQSEDALRKWVENKKAEFDKIPEN
jgi:hypothetical protein